MSLPLPRQLTLRDSRYDLEDVMSLSDPIKWYFRSMRSSTTPTSPSPPPKLAPQQKRNSSRMESPRLKSPSLPPGLLTRRRLTTLYLLPSRRPITSPNTSRPPGVCPRANSLINWCSEGVMMLRAGVGDGRRCYTWGTLRIVCYAIGRQKTFLLHA
jgi:hypothetical protein